MCGVSKTTTIIIIIIIVMIINCAKIQAVTKTIGEIVIAFICREHPLKHDDDDDNVIE